MNILYVVSDDRYFCSHRLNLAKAAVAAGHQVSVVCAVTEHANTIQQAGINLIPLDYQRTGLNMRGDIKLIWQLKQCFKLCQPDLIHVIALRMSLFAGLAAVWAKIPRRLYTITGLGHLFISTSGKMRLIRWLVCMIFKMLFKHKQSFVVVQNRDDEHIFLKLITAGRLRLIPGSGVDTAYFQPMPNKIRSAPPKVIMAARMVKEKGVFEFIEAARLLHQRQVACQMILVGDVHVANPSSFSVETMRQFEQDGVVQWWGHQKDMRAIWQQADLCVLPSYYPEGLPKSLLEAASCGLPIITTDSTGCRDAVVHGKTGWLVPAKSIEPLADAIEEAIEKPILCQQYGQVARQKVLMEFSDENIIVQFLSLYQAFGS